MLKSLSTFTVVLGLAVLFAAGPAKAQSGNSGSIEGVVKDSSGGVVAGATVEISYAVSGFKRETAIGGRHVHARRGGSHTLPVAAPRMRFSGGPKSRATKR